MLNFIELRTVNASLMHMKANFTILLGLFLTTLVSAETVYKSVDEEGNVIFSDSKTENAEVIEIQDAQALDMPKVRTFKLSPPKEKQQTPEYTKLVIVSPQNDSTIRSNQGNVTINTEIEPEIKDKDILVLYLDGKQVKTGKKPQLLLNDINRGTHTVDVAIKNEDGVELKRSSKVTFHVRQTSILFPNRANNQASPGTTTINQ